ncbi:Ran-binding protein-like protein [Polyplosphaeria fusca]|uniref:Ran-binding protein-like protein n=1 Tax=Polyplosphaeria fusca TaxID=682080 RepID=A0A9P4QU08_9PLEO|nr:Ran-binding protein-like protein [Polyplosphaeria fusca]
MFRRSSYASVAAGNAGSGQPQASGPARSGSISHLASTSGASPQPVHAHASRSADADGNHSSMSASWARGALLPSYSSQFGYMGYGSYDGQANTFFVPSYLKGSKYAEKLEDLHNARMASARELRSGHSSNAGSLSTSSSSINLHKMASTHRGMTHDIIERAPALADTISPWPTRWSEVDKFEQLEIEDNGRQAKYAGSQKSHDEAASVRADHPMPRQCGIYYFEVTVMSKGKDGRMIGVGFSGPKVPLSRIPGWEPESYAYHGDDGQSFSNTTSGKPYGPKFGTLDCIGCGINFRTGSAFFTKNGNLIGTAFRDLKPDRLYYPTVGMKRPGETLKANFGQEPFSFDIDAMVAEEKASILAEVADVSKSVLMNETAFIQRLVGQYLAHDGYVETAGAFAEESIAEARALATDGTEVPYTEMEEDLDAINRQKIRAAILEGDIDKALKHTKAYYPKVLRDNENIYFKLRCRKFIEMIRQCNELSLRRQAPPTPPSKRSTASNGFRNSIATDDYDSEMELDEQLGVLSGTGQWHADGMDTEDELEDKDAKLQQLLNETINYGTELKAEFAHDPRREVKRALEDTFALIAYENAGQSTLAALLETSGRVPVAEELNSAILVSLGKSSSAALERMLQQTEALVNELAEDGASGSFINVREDFLL